MRFVNKKYLVIVITILVVIEISSVHLMYQSSRNKETKLDDVKLLEENNIPEMFAIMLEQEDGTYAESDSSDWPTDMVYNEEMSGCIDTNGNKLDGVLSFDSNTNIASVETGNTSYCYLYFSYPPNLYELCGTYNSIDECETNENLEDIEGIWNSTLEDDGYRYVGTNPNNYICFGTTDVTQCSVDYETGDTDKYMYRIIGFFEDSEGKQHMKLIKKEALNTSCAWDTTYTSEVKWQDSDVYTGINGSYFLTDTTNYPYMADTTWTNKIATWDYTATNTKTYENYSTNSVYGPNYYNTTPVRSIYLHELNRSGKTSATCYYDSSTTADCSVGEWETVSAKIGLMYASDYNLSLGETALDYTNSTSKHFQSMRNGWMHITNNDTALSTTETPPHEWTMSRYGADSNGYYYAFRVRSDGNISWARVAYTESIRPVFYLTSDVQIFDGDGTSSNPYILEV